MLSAIGEELLHTYLETPYLITTQGNDLLTSSLSTPSPISSTLVNYGQVPGVWSQSTIPGQPPHSPSSQAVARPIKSQPGKDTGSLEYQSFTEKTASQRRQRNRVAQRAYRQRRLEYVEKLQADIVKLQSTVDQMRRENLQLKIAIERMDGENKLRWAALRWSTNLSPKQSPRLSTIVVDGADKTFTMHQIWEAIMKHDLYKGGAVKVNDVFQALQTEDGCAVTGQSLVKAIERCGPVSLGAHDCCHKDSTCRDG